MMLASGFMDFMSGVLMFLMAFCCVGGLLFRKFDNDGAVKSAAKEAAKRGVVNLLGRWLK